MMRKKEWIIEKLIEHEYDTSVLNTPEYYKEFLQATGSSGTFQSYYKQLWKYYKQLTEDETLEITPIAQQEKENERIKYLEYDENDLIEMLEQEIQDKQSTLSMDDVKAVASKNNVPYRAFIYQIPDLRKVLKELYNINLFHIESDKKVNKVKQENKVIKKELKYYKDNDAKDEKLIEVLEEVVQEYKPFKYSPLRINKKNFNDKAEAVVQMSDWHFDEIVNADQMLNINEFSVEIAKRRIDKLFADATYNASVFGITTINLLFLGDMISGNLHDLAENNELGVTKSIVQLTDYVAQNIRNLTKYFDKIKILGLVGNHSRTHQKPRYKNKQTENYEYLLYELIKREVRQFAEFDLPESYMRLHDIMGHTFLSLHGDTIKGGGGLNAIPGNLSRDISKYAGTLSQSNLWFEYVNMGHFHSANITKAFQGAKVIMNGSLIGANEFSLGAIKKGEAPVQNFYIVDEENGVRFIDEIKLNIR